MNRISRNLAFYTALLSMCSVASVAYARGGGAAAGAAAGAGLRAGASAITSRAQVTGIESSAAAADANLPNNAPNAPQAKPVDPCQPPTLMDGWYMGVQLGYGAYRIRNSIAFPAGSTYVLNPVNNASNWSAGALIGFGRMMNRFFYMGAELFIDANNLEQQFTLNNGVTSYTNQSLSGPTYGFGLLPGIKLTNETLTFIRLGWNRVELKTNESISGVATNQTSKTMDGFAFGIGMETLITTNYSIRGEYDHMYFGSYNTTGAYNTEVSPSNNQFMLSIIYHAGM